MKTKTKVKNSEDGATDVDSNSTHLKLLKNVIVEESRTGAITRLLKSIGSAFKRKNDLTLEQWRRLESKPQKTIRFYDNF